LDLLFAADVRMRNTDAVESIRAGQRFGEWTVGRKRLGGGGNGEVWGVATADGRRGAIKVLSRRSGSEGVYRLGRFKDEISFLLAHPDFPGILPLLDSHISDDPGELSWYVMPVATPIREALGSDPDPAVVVTAAAEVASTLEALAAEGVAHRDIKPDNLFRLGDRWVIGDFGLVTYPEKDPRTEHGRRLGPIDFMAPEMRADADRAEPGPADVWALAKTIWVLLTGQQLPLPGTHRPADPAHSLQVRVTFRFSAELDLLLEGATQIEPEDRVSIVDAARELRACLASPAEARPSASLTELSTRAAALTATSRQNMTDTQDRRARVQAAWEELSQTVAGAAHELADLLTFDVHRQENGYQAAAMIERPPFIPYEAQSSGWLLIPPGQPRPNVELVAAVAMRVLSRDDPADITVLLEVDRIIGDGSAHDVREIWSHVYRGIPLTSARQANVFVEIRTNLTNGFNEAMRQAISVLADDRFIDE
jgi:hypothetical protein